MKRKGEKYLFNNNIFDEPNIEEEEELIPPTPTFSEEELETVRQTTYEKAYELGKQDGIKERTESIENTVSQTLKKIEQSASLLFTAETEREKLYEVEAVNLCLAIFEKLLPEYMGRKGQDELKTVLTNILEKQENPSIQVDVHPSTHSDISQYLTTLQLQNGVKPRFDIVENDTVGTNDCRLSWKNGGAVRNAEALSDEIRTIMQQALAGTQTNVHDNNSTLQNPENLESPDQPPSEKQDTGDTNNNLEAPDTMEKPDE